MIVALLVFALASVVSECVERLSDISLLQTGLIAPEDEATHMKATLNRTVHGSTEAPTDHSLLEAATTNVSESSDLKTRLVIDSIVDKRDEDTGTDSENAFAASSNAAPLVVESFAEKPPGFYVEAEKEEGFWRTFFEAFCVIGVAELFDKTWFVTVFLALREGPLAGFMGSFLALIAHAAFCTWVGSHFASFVKESTLDFAAAALFSFFAILYAKDACEADPDSDILSAGKAEVADNRNVLNNGDVTSSNTGACGNALEATKILKEPEKPTTVFTLQRFGTAFLTVFLAEWGDRTQIVMISLSSSMPEAPVFFGAALAEFLLCVSAILAASMLDKQRLSERWVFGLVALSFLFFAALSVMDGMKMKRQGE